MSKKIYFEDNDEGEGRALKSWRQILEDECRDEIVLMLGTIEKGSDYFYCMEVGEIGDKSEGTCGKFCGDYKPRNGRSGICKYFRSTYDCDEENKFLLKKGKRLTKIKNII